MTYDKPTTKDEASDAKAGAIIGTSTTIVLLFISYLLSTFLWSDMVLIRVVTGVGILVLVFTAILTGWSAQQLWNDAMAYLEENDD